MEWNQIPYTFESKLIKNHLLLLLRDKFYFLFAFNCPAKKLPLDVDPIGVFACNELNLKELNVYGFDYDYTLACYKQSLNYLLYNLGRDELVNKFKVQGVNSKVLLLEENKNQRREFENSANSARDSVY